MSTGTLEAPPNEGGDDRDPAVAALKQAREIADLELVYRASSGTPTAERAQKSEGERLEGNITLFSDIVPEVAGPLAVRHAVRESTRNYAAGTGGENSAFVDKAVHKRQRARRQGVVLLQAYQGAQRIRF